MKLRNQKQLRMGVQDNPEDSATDVEYEEVK